jgi:ribosomal protein S18 acetylase RimI-like enzyme
MTFNMQVIQQATLPDVPALNELINSAYRGDSAKRGWTNEAHLLDGTRCDEEMLNGFLQEPGTIFLKYLEGDKILGCVKLDKHYDKLYLGMLTVSPELQGGGIGKKLLKASEEEALRQQCNTVYMTVISVRPELIAWYERHGYVHTGEVKPFIADDPRFGTPKVPFEMLVLEKKLS